MLFDDTFSFLDFHFNSYANFFFKHRNKLIGGVLDITVEDISVKSIDSDVMDALPEVSDALILQHEKDGTTLSCSVKVTLEIKFGEEVRRIESVICDIPYPTTNGFYLINGNRRVFVPQILRTRGVFFSSTGDAILAHLNPEHGSNITFSTKVSRDVTYVFCSVNDIKAAWFILPCALFYNNLDELFSDMFSTTTVSRNNFDSGAQMLDQGYFIKPSLLSSTKESNVVKAQTMYFDKSTDEQFEVFYIEEPYRILLNNINVTLFEATACAEAFYNMLRGSLISGDKMEYLKKHFASEEYFSFGKTGRRVLNLRFHDKNAKNVDDMTLNENDIIETVKYLCCIKNEEKGCVADDTRNLAHRYVRGIEEFIYNDLRTSLYAARQYLVDRINGFLSKQTKTIEALCILVQESINFKAIQSRIMKLFTQNSCSQFLEQLNPLSDLLHRTKVTAMGEEGLSKEFASSEVRNINDSFYGRLCCLSTPEGQNVGLVNFACVHTHVNEYGHLCSPYFAVVNGKVDKSKICYISAYEEYANEYSIAQYVTKIDENGYIVDERVLCRFKQDIVYFPKTEVSFIEAFNNQFIAISASLVPFLEHNDNIRANMASNMQRQALPLVRTRKPTITAGTEEYAIRKSGYNIYYAEAAEGVVIECDSKHIVVQNSNKRCEYALSYFARSNQNTSIGHRIVVQLGQKVKQGDLLADSFCSEDGKLALGVDLFVAVMPFFGWNYEDAVVISDRCIKEDLLSAVIINEYEVVVRKTPRGKEIVTRNIPNVKRSHIAHLDEHGVAKIGTFVKGNDILVGKLTPKVSQHLSKMDEQFIRDALGAYAVDYKDSSLRIPTYMSGTVIDVVRIESTESTKIHENKVEVIKIYVAKKSSVKEGDKICGRYGNKTVIAKILSEHDMPFTADGRKVDMVINPLGITSRMNIGQIMEMNLTLAMKALNIDHISAHPYCEYNSTQIENMLTEANLNPEGKLQLYDGRTGEAFSKPVVAGYMYTLRLEHMVDAKFHARSVGRNLLITQQPVGGKSQGGGQRCGEMETWALESYGAANTIMEKLLLLSDDIYNKELLLKRIIYGVGKYSFGTPSTFNVFLKELNALMLKVTVKKTKPLIKSEDNKDELQ